MLAVFSLPLIPCALGSLLLLSQSLAARIPSVHDKWTYYSSSKVIFLVKILSSQKKAAEACVKGGVNSDVNDGLWVTVVCQSRLISLNKCATLLGVLIMGELVPARGRGYMENPSSVNFAVNLEWL